MEILRNFGVLRTVYLHMFYISEVGITYLGLLSSNFGLHSKHEYYHRTSDNDRQKVELCPTKAAS